MFRVPAQTLHTQSDNGRETDGLEEEGKVKHRESCVSILCDGWSEEDDTAGDKTEEHPTRPEITHQGNTEKSSERKGPLSASEELGSEYRIGIRASLDCPVDKETKNMSTTAADTRDTKQTWRLQLVPQRSRTEQMRHGRACIAERMAYQQPRHASPQLEIPCLHQ